MKRHLLLILVSIAMFIPRLYSQTPDVIYIHNESTSAITPIDPSDSTTDAQLTYNNATQCYEGYIYNWVIMLGTKDTNAKVFYSIENDVVTYYGPSFGMWNLTSAEQGEPGYVKTISINESIGAVNNIQPTYLYTLTSQTGISMINVAVSLSLENKTLTFTVIEGEEGTNVPELVSVDPANGSTLDPGENGSVTIELTFSGEVTSMEALVDGTDINSPNTSINGGEDWSGNISSNADGTVWTLIVPSKLIRLGTSDNGGRLRINVMRVKADDMVVTFESGATLSLEYNIAGVTNLATLDFEGTSEALQALAVYQAPNYNVGTDELKINDNTLEVAFGSSITYLFTVPEDYEIDITSSIESEDEQNWSIGKAWSILVTVDPDTERVTETKYLEGPTLTINTDGKDATYTISVKPSLAAVDRIYKENQEGMIYDLRGMKVDSNKLLKGIYIINGKKVLVK